MNETIQILADGTMFMVATPYTPSESRAGVVLVLISCLSLVCVLGLLAAIITSAFKTRSSEDPNLFVRTHVASYFVSLLLCCFFQAVGGIMSSNWIRKSGVIAGSYCTAQGAIKHIADVGIASWFFVIAFHTFFALWRSDRPARPAREIFGYTIDAETLVHYITLASTWVFIILAIGIANATQNTQTRGAFYGVSGDWCWITDGYGAERIIFDYLLIFLSALSAFALNVAVFVRVRRKLRVEKPSSKFVLSEKDQTDEYRVMLARHMVYHPLAYFGCIFPIAVVRFASWAGNDVSYGGTIFADFVYLLIGIVIVVLFLSTPRLLPPRSYLPAWVANFQLPSYDNKSRGASDYEDPYYSTNGEKGPLAANTEYDPEHALVAPHQSLHVSLPYPKPVYAAENPYATPLYFNDRNLSDSPESTPRGIVLHPAATDRYSSASSMTVTARPSSRASARSVASMNKPLPRRPVVGLPDGPSPYAPQNTSRHSRSSSAPSQPRRGPLGLGGYGLPSGPAAHRRTGSAPHAVNSRALPRQANQVPSARQQYRSPGPRTANDSRPMSGASDSTSFSWAYNFRMSAATDSRPPSIASEPRYSPVAHRLKQSRGDHLSSLRREITQAQAEWENIEISQYRSESRASRRSNSSRGSRRSDHTAVEMYDERDDSDANTFEIVTRPESYIPPKSARIQPGTPPNPDVPRFTRMSSVEELE